MKSTRRANFKQPDNTSFLFDTHLDVNEDTRLKVNTILNQILCDLITLRLIFRTAHWNIKGMHFIALHEMFDKLQDIIDEQADRVAETITSYGGIAFGRVEDLSNCCVDEFDIYTTDVADEPCGAARKYLIQLDNSTCCTIKYMREKMLYIDDTLKDKVTSNMLQDLLGQLQKITYFLESHLQRI